MIGLVKELQFLLEVVDKCRTYWIAFLLYFVSFSSGSDVVRKLDKLAKMLLHIMFNRSNNVIAKRR